MPPDRPLDCLVIGAGHAGLAIAWYLRQAGLRFVVLERGRVAETWRSQRWDSFRLNTPNHLNRLPGMPYDGPDPDGFWHRDELIAAFEEYVRRYALPVREHSTVTAVERHDAATFAVRVDGAAGAAPPWLSCTVVVASGIQQRPRLPACAARVPADVVQLHTADYRNPGQLPPGAVVVVGGGQSGCQVAEDLLAAGRRVYLCVSRVARVRRRWRGRDILAWWWDHGTFRVRPEELEDPAMRFAIQPQVSGVGPRGHTLSYQQLERDGVTLLGHLTDAADGALVLETDIGQHIRYADERSAFFRKETDDAIVRSGLALPPAEDDPADDSAEHRWNATGPARLDLRAAGVSGIVWCTGFTGDFSWLKLPVLDERGLPVHRDGASPEPGLWFLGFPWLRCRGSGIIPGIETDAARLAVEIRTFLERPPRRAAAD